MKLNDIVMASTQDTKIRVVVNCTERASAQNIFQNTS